MWGRNGMAELFSSTDLNAQVQLVRNLLKHEAFSKLPVERQLAAYPYTQNVHKANLICRIMKELWPYPEGDKLFDIFKQFENFLTAIGQRGHFIHQFEVFLLGLNVILTMVDEQPKSFKVKSSNDLIMIWMLTSMTHDFGYPIQYSSKILSTLSLLYEKFDLDYLRDRYDSVKISSVLDREPNLNTFEFQLKDDNKVKYRYDINDLVHEVIKSSFKISKENSKNLQSLMIEKKDHGYLSARMLCRAIFKNHTSLSEFNAIDNLNILPTLKLAMGAIIGHNFAAYKNGSDYEYLACLDFIKNPFAYLLFIIDNIQDWNRTIIENDEYPEYHLAEYSYNNKKWKLTYLLIHDDWSTPRIDSLEKSIADRKLMFDQLIKPTKLLGYSFSIYFIANDSYQFRNFIEIAI